MIRAILFVFGIIFLLAAIGLAIWLGIVFARSSEEVRDDKKNLEHELRRIRDKYQDRVWRLNSSSPKFAEEKANLEAEMKAEQEAFVKDWETPRRKGLPGFISCLVASLALLGFVIIIPGSIHQVDTGSVAVVRHLGKITHMRNPGTYFDFYMVNHYEIYDTKVQQDKIVTAAYSRDGQTMELEVFLQYQVQPEHIMDIATQYGSLDALQSRIETQTIEKTKAVMSSDIAMNIIQNRAQFSNDVSDAVRTGISADYYVNVKDVVLTNIDFTDEFERSVEAKVIAEQEKTAAITRAEAEKQTAIIKAEQELETARIEAEKKIVEAQADAQQQIILAEAAAKAATAKVIELARATGFPIETAYVYSNSETGLSEVHDTPIAETETIKFVETRYTISYDATHTKDDLDKLVISYLEYLAYLEKWNGELPQVVAGDDALSIIVPGSGNNP